MLELLLCSLLTIFPDYLYRRYRQGKRLGHEITFYFGVVRTEVGHHRLSHADGGADHGHLLFSSIDHDGDFILQDRPDHSGNNGPRVGSSRWIRQRSRQEG
jgi:hypothetical protein